MKIFFPFQNKGAGFMGVTTFALKFKAGMEARGHEVFFEYRPDYDVLFMIVQAPFKYLLEAKRRKKPIIQRLDGVFYFSGVGWKYPLLNLKACLIRHLFTDLTIYQSEFSKYSAQKFLGKKYADRSALIYNGVDLTVFSPEGDQKDMRDNPLQKVFFTASSFRRPDQIIPILQAFQYYRDHYREDCKLIVAGPFRGRVSHVPQECKHFKNVSFLGKIENMDLPLYERAADVFLFTHFNPPCPNNVLEALGSGLPICGVADGAMPELIESQKNGLLIPAFGDAFWKTRSYDIKLFAKNLDSIVREHSHYSKNARKSALERFSLEEMILRYEKELLTLLTLRKHNEI